MHQKTTQAVISDQAEFRPHQKTENFALFNEDGTPVSGRDSVYAPVVVAGAIGTAAKTTTSPQPKTNSIVPIRFTSGNSAAAPTVAFAGGTARVIHLGGSTPAAIETTIAANGVVLYWFDGTILHQIGVTS